MGISACVSVCVYVQKAIDGLCVFVGMGVGGGKFYLRYTALPHVLWVNLLFPALCQVINRLD